MSDLIALTNCSDVPELRDALTRLCAAYGPVARLDILCAGHGGQREALCLLRLETAEQEGRLMRELGIGRFGGDLIVVASLQARTAAKHAAMALNSHMGAAPLAA
jgi:predicted secreted protein